MKILNCYAGLGGNRKLWQGCQVTAIELDPKIAALYARFYPHDTLIIGDAHEYLRQHYAEFDFIWTSPPCPTHSVMAKATRHKNRKYPDMTLYQEILFLQHFFKGKYVVENVTPFYDVLIPARPMGRHLFWANFHFDEFHVPSPSNFINRVDLAGKKALQDWLGIHYEENIYYGDHHCPAQILRNCVHPLLGRHIMDAAQGIKSTVNPQETMFHGL